MREAGGGGQEKFKKIFHSFWEVAEMQKIVTSSWEYEAWNRKSRRDFTRRNKTSFKRGSREFEKGGRQEEFKGRPWGLRGPK